MYAHRSVVEQKLAIIEIIKRYPGYALTRIASISGVGHKQTKKYALLMEESGVLTKYKKGYVCTQKANVAFQFWKQICEIMGEDSAVNQTRT